MREYFGYQDMLQEVRKSGKPQPSAGGDTIELQNVTLVSAAGTIVSRKNLNYGLGFAEALLVLQGIHSIDVIARAAPKSNRALYDDYHSLGPRFAAQMQPLIDLLRTDPDTRQAVLFAGLPTDVANKSITCTTSGQYLLRDNLLHATWTMRSNDIIRGVPYDLMVFGVLSHVIAAILGVQPGNITLQATSMHWYTKMRLEDCLPSNRGTKHFKLALPELWTGVDWSTVQEAAQEELRRLEQWHGKIPGIFHIYS